MKLETHVHTRYSKDSLLCFWALYVKCLIMKIDYIAITEHNNINGGINFKKFCLKHGNKVQVIVGEEIFTNSGEIIGLFLEDNISPGLSVEETIKKIKQQDGVVYIPHPYDKKREKTVLKESAISEFRDQIDCIEIHNGRNISNEYDIKQHEIAIKYGLTPVIGSDAHTWIEVGRNYMISNCCCLDNSEQFIHLIKKCSFHSAKCIKVTHEITKFAKLVKLLKRKNK